jgi:hypothetical protein
VRLAVPDLARVDASVGHLQLHVGFHVFLRVVCVRMVRAGASCSAGDSDRVVCSGVVCSGVEREQQPALKSTLPNQEENNKNLYVRVDSSSGSINRSIGRVCV